MPLLRIALFLLLTALGMVGVFGAMVALALRVPAPLPAPAPGARFASVRLIEASANAAPDWQSAPPARSTRRQGPFSLEVRGNRIHAIGPPRTDSGDRYAGAYALRGLTDMHAHLPMTDFPGDAEYSALLFLLHGVTTARLIGGVDPEFATGWNARVASGEAVGPRFFSCGPILDGPAPVIPGSRSIVGAEQARATVDELADRGADCIKAYDHLDLETTTALREQAHAHGLRIVGHTPQALDLESARLDDVQHLRGVHPPFTEEERANLGFPGYLRAWDRHDEARIAEVIDVSRRHRIAHTPTLVATEGHVASADWARWSRSPGMQLWLPHLRDAVWSGEVGFGPARFSSADELAMIERARSRMATSVLALHRAGIPLHTGTDANAPNVVPGASLHRELELLVAAGLAPEAAIVASIHTSPTFLGIGRASELREGSSASFVLFAEDPTQDIAALDSLLAVVHEGRLYSRAELEERLERYREHYRGFAYGSVLLPSMRTGLRALTGWLAGRHDAD